MVMALIGIGEREKRAKLRMNVNQGVRISSIMLFTGIPEMR